MSIIIPMKQYCFSLENSFLQNGLVSCLEEMYNQAMPVIVCVGTDGVVGDSLGPLVGSFLKEKWTSSEQLITEKS